MSRATTSGEVRKRAAVSFTRGGLYYAAMLALDEEALRARFSLVEIDEEGVLLDRESGAVFRLNRNARAIWAALIAGASPVTIAAQIVQRFGIAPERAQRDVSAALTEHPDERTAQIAAQNRPAARLEAGRWGETPSGYAFFDRGAVNCEVDRAGTFLRLPAGARPTESEARARIRSVVPRVLALRGIHLLHASAVEIDGALLVITGASGAGKTTSARAFARTGARLVSEDLLIFALSAAGPRAVIDGERTIRAWVAERAMQLARQPEEVIPCAELERCLEGPQLAVGAIWIIDAASRSGGLIGLEPLLRPEALVALMESVYFASSDGGTWSARLEALRDLVAGVTSSRATMPEGLSPLEAGVGAFRQRQREMIAS
jgi:Coenzyme PQQ synthesis protein D (PqqD)